MHLKSLTVKGFKSFPDRTRLAFGEGVSVIVGPNGSGKSNVTDAVLWAMGEQSPLAVRGASMQDVIFGGGRGRHGAREAVVELVLDNSDGGLDVELSEISILRRLDRGGDGEYRLNGARCRLVDVLEVLSDTGLGKESHSVVSQGRVESIVTSKPRDRRLLIEEAAGLGKHRKRRRRAQLKLARTQENLDRALDVEREARSRLRPLKRQAEAAELHERLERQSLEARWELGRDELRAARAALEEAEAASAAVRARRGEAEAALTAVVARRQAAEQALAARSERREVLSRRCYAARSATERVALRREAAQTLIASLKERIVRREAELEALVAEAAADAPDEGAPGRVAALEAELAGLERDRRTELERELSELASRRVAAARELESAEQACAEVRAELARAEGAVAAARAARQEAERAVQSARREAANAGGELAAANQFLRAHGGALGGARALADDLGVEPGYELALAAALGARLRAAIVEDVGAGTALLARAERDGGSAIVTGASARAAAAADEAAAPVTGAVALRDRLHGPEPALSLARALLSDAWVVDDLASLPAGFAGTAVTRDGWAWLGGSRELRRLAAGGDERVLAERNRRDALVARSEAAAAAEVDAARVMQATEAELVAAETAREEVDGRRRAADRARDEAAEEERRAAWLIERRRAAADAGPAAVRRGQIEAELAAERRLAERAERDRVDRERRRQRVLGRVARERTLLPGAERLAGALGAATEAISDRLESFEAELAADRAAGEGVAAELRACAQEEAGVQGRLRELGDEVTRVEVRAQQTRDRAAEVGAELAALAQRLELEPEPAAEPLAEEQRAALAQRVERLARRREQLGPVNPLAGEEYADALGHVEELEGQREDLEAALRELAGLIRETDRQIRQTFEETFAAAAANFEELAAQLFPGGRGRLRLVREDAGPRPVLGGEAVEEGDGDGESEVAPEDEDPARDEDDLTGVEIEVTPAGKAMKRLSLLSGGEKSMTALAFLFAVFLARPCPFYILDEVEAALDDLNIDRFLALLRRYRERAQFIVVTHQKRTMEAADCLYGVSMGDDGISKVVSRRLPAAVEDSPGREAAAGAA